MSEGFAIGIFLVLVGLTVSLDESVVERVGELIRRFICQ